MDTVPLIVPQHMFFQSLEQLSVELHHRNIAVMIETQQALDPSLLKRAVKHLLEYHDALRLRFQKSNSGWYQFIAGSDCTVEPFTHIDLSTFSESEQKISIERAAAEFQKSLNLSEGPLVQVVLFDLGIRKPSRLLTIVHHLVFDAISWKVFHQDLQTAYQQLSRGREIELLPKTTSFRCWAQRLTKFAQSELFQQELGYWLAEPQKWESHLPVDHPEGENTMASVRTVSTVLSIDETRALLEASKVYGNQVNLHDVLVTALVYTFARWIGRRSLPILLAVHGREAIFENVDLSRTVGGFALQTPVALDLGEVLRLEDMIKTISEQIRCIPIGGLGYGMLRYLGENAEVANRLSALPKPKVSFNYRGQLVDRFLRESSLFRPARESVGARHGRKGNRDLLFQVDGSITGNRLQLLWRYSENLCRRSTIEHLVYDFLKVLPLDTPNKSLVSDL